MTKQIFTTVVLALAMGIGLAQFASAQAPMTGKTDPALTKLAKAWEAAFNAKEIAKVASGDWPREENPLVNAPHTAWCLTEKWAHSYTLAEAAYPDGVDPAAKYWPPVRRIDGAYGDRNLVCACPPVADYA